MKHIVTIWGANFSCVEELEAFIETGYDDDGDTIPSDFLASIGCSCIDEDFLEMHFHNNEEERRAFTEYLRSGYLPDQPFAEQLPATIGETVRDYNSIILLCGSDSPYGAINEELFEIVEKDLPASSSIKLLASVVYESR